MATTSKKPNILPPARASERPLTSWWDMLPDEAPFNQLVLPEGYETGSVPLRKTRTQQIITTTPLLPITEIDDVDGGGLHYEIILIDPRRLTYTKHVVPVIQLRNQRSLFELTASGLDISSGSEKPLIEFLQDYLRVNQLPRRRQTHRIGWRPSPTGGTGFYLLERVYPQGEPIHFEPPDEDAAKFVGALPPRGSIEAWRSAFEAILDFPTVVLAVCASCVPPLRELLPLEIPNFWIHLHAMSSTGKTATQRLAASVWANPFEDKWLPSSGSYAGIEKLCLRVYGLPVFMQETQCIKEHELPVLVYSIGNGSFKARGGDRRTQATWHGVMISSGEKPVIDEDSLAGEAARVISCVGPPFEQAESDEIRRLIDKMLEPLLHHNYGLVGRAIVSRALELPLAERERVRGQWDVSREEFARRAAGHPLLPRQAGQWAAMALAGEWLAAIIGSNPVRIRAAIDVAFERARHLLAPSPARRAYNLLIAEIQAQARACYRWNGKEYLDPRLPGRAVGAIRAGEFVAIFSSVAEDILRRHRFERPTALLSAMEQEDLVLVDRKHKHGRVARDGKQVRAWKLKWPDAWKKTFREDETWDQSALEALKPPDESDDGTEKVV